ncbi:MAG: hypothetical protein EWM73_01416 [Nitrospira sp.]|nr:MAG: hypothetical protein EWM73_01416 [Nitrospira sp.]
MWAWKCVRLNLRTNNALGEWARKRHRQIVESGEKDPAEHLVTVARRYREETLTGCGKTI